MIVPQGVPCPICRGAGFYLQASAAGDEDQARMVRCGCMAQADALALAARMDRLSDMTRSMRRMTFASWDTERHHAAYASLRAFAAQPEGWRILLGPPGNGKTHLMAATMQALRAAGWGAVYCVTPDLLDRLRAAIDQEGGYHRLLRQLKEVAVLLLDDYGAEQATEWASEKLYSILDYRYRDERPTVIASNVQLKEWASFRLASRAQDAGLAELYTLKGDDYRPHAPKRAARAAGRGDE